MKKLINWLYVLEWLGRILAIGAFIAVIWTVCLYGCNNSRRAVDNIAAETAKGLSKPLKPGGIGSPQQQPPELKWNDTDLVRAIWLTEGGSKAKYAYGIESVKYSSKAEARQVCYRTIKNNRARWGRAGCPGDFLSYLSKVYCPHNHKVWLKNVKYFLGIE